jgi:uncharacterized protein
MKTVPCPVCKCPAQWTDNPFRPFCSDACKQKDLGNWAMESYRVPVEDSWEKEDKPMWVPKIVPNPDDSGSDED